MRDSYAVLISVLIPAVIVSASPGWYAIAGAVGGAVIVGVANQWVARQQRHADAASFERQLEHDRALRLAEIEAAAARLDEQLAHDRGLRDLEHVRSIVGPIAVRVVGVRDPAWGLTEAIRRARESHEESEDMTAVARYRTEIAEDELRFHRDAVVLSGVLGPESDVVAALIDISDYNRAISSVAGDWLSGSCSAAEAEAKITALRKASGGSVLARFVVAVNKTAGWHSPRRSAGEAPVVGEVGNAAVPGSTVSSPTAPEADPPGSQ